MSYGELNDSLEMLLKKNGVPFDEFVLTEGNEEAVVYDHYDAEIAKYAIYSEGNRQLVPISKIVGTYEQMLKERKNLIFNFCNMFDPNGDGYHSRANEMLEYSTDEVLSKMAPSFEKEAFVVCKIGNKYFATSGFHRFFLFKMHEMISKFKGLNSKEVDSKFMIPAVVREIDYLKTYMNYLGSLLWDERFKLYQVYDEEYKATKQVKVESSEGQEIMTTEELIEYVRDRFKALENLDRDFFEDALRQIWQKGEWEKSGLFKQTITTYLPEFAQVFEAKDGMELEEVVQSISVGGLNYGNN